MIDEPDSIHLDSQTLDLRLVRIGAGWHDSAIHRSFLQKIGLEKIPDFDVDLMALLLNAEGKYVNRGVVRDFGGGRLVGMSDSDLVHFNNLQHPSGAVWIGDEGLTVGIPGESEQIFIKLDQLPSETHSVVFWVCAQHAGSKGQHLGQLDGLFFRICDGQEIQVARWELEKEKLKDVACLEIGRLNRSNGNWNFQATFDPLPDQDFLELLQRFSNDLPKP